MDVTLENTNVWAISEHCNVGGVEIYHKLDCQSVFLQGDDCNHFLAELNSMEICHTDENSAWYNKTWNQCLDAICSDYFTQ